MHSASNVATSLGQAALQVDFERLARLGYLPELSIPTNTLDIQVFLRMKEGFDIILILRT